MDSDLFNIYLLDLLSIMHFSFESSSFFFFDKPKSHLSTFDQKVQK